MTEAARIPGPARRPLMALAGALLLLAGVAGATAEPPTSEANRLLFQTDQLSGVEPPADLHYRFVSRPREGEGDGFEDAIVLHVTPGETAGARRVEVDYFSGERHRYVPPVERASGNPVVMVFLQRDVTEMQQRTQGNWRYFQRAIKFALEDGAQVRPVTFTFHGHETAGTEVRFQPYRKLGREEALRLLGGKTYVITLSDAVPGGVYQMRTVVPGETPEAPALLEETLTYNDS